MTLDDAYKLMKQIDKFEEKHFPLRPEYRVIGELMNRMKVAEGKEKFLLQMKLNRALRMVECMEAFDPNDPANYGIITRDDAPSADREDERDEDQEGEEGRVDDDGLELDDLKEKDSKFLEKINEIDKLLEQKLTELEYTFGKKGKLLEEEIRDLAEERNSLTEKKRQPLYRKVSACICQSITCLHCLMILIILMTTAYQRFYSAKAVPEFHVLLIVCFIMPKCYIDACLVSAIIVSIYPSCM